MSEKKAPDNKREKEKERLIHVTEEQLQAGKAEIMKIVAGLNGAEKLADLLDKGRKKGNLSSNELMDALEEIDLESDQMDKIYDVLENMGIDTAGEDYLPELIRFKSQDLFDFLGDILAGHQCFIAGLILFIQGCLHGNMPCTCPPFFSNFLLRAPFDPV